MKGIAATSWGPQRLDVFSLERDFSMKHLAYDPTPSTGVGVAGASVLNTIGGIDRLGGPFASVPAAVVSLAQVPIVATTGDAIGKTGTPHAPAIQLAEPHDAGQHPLEGVEPHPTAPPQATTGPVGTPTGGGTIGPVHPPVPMQHRIDVFALDAGYAMRHLELWNGQAPSQQPPHWTNLGGIFISTPAAVAWGDRVDVFGVGLDRKLYRKTLRANVWTPQWQSVGGTFTSEASAVSWGPRRLDVFARGADFSLRHKGYDGSTETDWQNLGGSLASPPVAVSWGLNRLDVFAVADDGTLGHRWWDGMLWNDWEHFGMPTPGKKFVATPSAVSWGPDRIDVFVAGEDGAVYHLWYVDNAFQGPESLGQLAPPASPVFTPSPIALSYGANRLSLFAATNQIDSNGNAVAPKMGYRTWDGAAWRGWTTFGDVGLPRYRFSVDFFTVKTARSLNQDTDVAQATLRVGNAPVRAATQFMGDWGGTGPGQAQVQQLEFEPVTVELCEYAIFNYQIVNSAKADTSEMKAALNTAGTKLVDFATDSIKKALGAGLTAITTIEVATITSVPVIGTILGLLSNWLFEQLGSLFSEGHCDGSVALEQALISGRDLHLATAGGHAYLKTTDHPGTDSPTGCGANSDYSVTWSIRRV